MSTTNRGKTPVKQKQKSQTQTNPKIILNYLDYELNQFDLEYLKQLQNLFVKGKQAKINKHIDWMQKKQNDFRHKIAKLIFEIVKKNSNQNKYQNGNQEANIFYKKANIVQNSFKILLQELNTLKFGHTIGFLDSKQFKQNCDTKFINQVQKYIIRLKQLQNFGHQFEQMENILNIRQTQLSTYQNILNNLDDCPKLVNIVSEIKRINLFDEKIIQKLQDLTLKLDDYKNSSKQKASNKWLKHFLEIISYRFDRQKIFALQSFVNEQLNNAQLKSIMDTLKNFCLRKNQEQQFKEKINKMTINNAKTVEETCFFFNNIKQSNLRSKFESMFTKQLAIQIIQKNNPKRSNKNQSFISQICNGYLQKMNHYGYQVSKVQNFSSSQLLNIRQRLLDLEYIIGSKQKQQLGQKKFFIVQDEDLLYEIQASIQRMTVFLTNQNKKLHQNQSLLKKSQTTTSSSNLISSKQSNRNQNQNAQTIKISLKDIKQIAGSKDKIQTALQQLKRAAVFYKGKSLSKIDLTIGYYTISSSLFDQNFKLISQKVKRIQQITKENQNSNSKQKKAPFIRTNQPIIKSQVRNIDKINSNNFNSNSFQIQQLQQQLYSQKIYAKNNLQEITKLKSQLEHIKKTNENLLIQNNKLKKFLVQSLQQSQNRINGLHNLCNQKDIQIINLKQSNTKISEDLNKLNQQVNRYKKISEEKNRTQTQLLTELKHIKNELKIKTSQNEGLISQISSLNAKITSKNNEVFLKESQIRALKKKQQQLNSKIAKYEAYTTEKDQKVQNITNELKEKQMLIKDLQTQNIQIVSKNTIEIIPEKKKQLSEQQKQSVQQRRGNFRSFNNRQKSNTKNITSTNKVVSNSPTKNLQIKINLLTVQNNRQSNLPPIKQKINHQNQIQQSDIKQKLKIQPKVFSQTLMSEMKYKIKQSQNLTIKQIYQSPKIDNKLNQINVSLKKKSQQQWINQLKQKELKIGSLNQQILRLNSSIQSLNKKIEEIEEISNQNSSHKQYIENLLKSNQKLREQQKKCIQLQSQIKKMKKQKQLVQEKLRKTTLQFQNHRNKFNEDKKSQEIGQSELKKLQQDLSEKCNQIAQMQKTITNLSQEVSNLQQDKTNLQKKIQDFEKKQKETFQITTSKSQIKSTGNQKGKNEQINPQLQAYKKQMKVKILQLELDLDQKQQLYQELKEKHKKQITALKNQIQTLSSSTPGLQSEISNLKNELQTKQSALNNKLKEAQNLHAKIVQLQAGIQKQNEDKQRFVEQIKDLKKENESMERQITRLCDGRDKLESENNSLIDKYRNQQKLHKEEIDKLKKDQAAQIRSLRLENARQVQEIRRQIKSAQYSQRIKANTQKQGESNVLMKMQHEKLKRDFELLQKSNKEKQQVIKELEINLKSLQNTLNQKEKQIKNIKDKNRHLQQLMRQLEKKLAPIKGGLKQISTVIFDRFFQNEALYRQFYKKYLLYDLIQLQTKKTIKSTTLLYRLDKLNKVNFHEYVDCINNVVAIIKTSNGNIFGGFSTSKLEKGYKQPAGTVSFIFTFDSPNTIEHFTLDEKKKLNLKSFDWDEYFFVFGNAEIRWRFGERKIYSNFAINNGYYETKGKDVSALLQQGSSRETSIVALDFYQVQFEQ